ncbi:MAG: InlB B-repeat-containing protein, partial [Clostridiales bacterium]|nr:InlB B-repeat-containing protein [Clostridiales bacterium]
FTVTCISDAGTSVAPLTVNEGTYATKPSDPTKAASTFLGWFHGNETTAFDFENTAITGDIELTAKWDVATYAVTFDLNGVEATAIPQQTIKHGEKVQKPADPTNEDNQFIGWYTDAACTDEKAWSFDTGVTEEMTLYAKWMALTNKFMFVNGTTQLRMYDNSLNNTDATVEEEYTLLGAELEAGVELTFQIKSGATFTPIAFIYDTYSTGVTSGTNKLTTTRAGSFDIYLKLLTSGEWKVYAEGGNVNVPDDAVEVTDDDTAYLVGKFGDHDLSDDHGYALTKGGSQYTIKMALSVGDLGAVRVKGWSDFRCTVIENADYMTENNIIKEVTVDGVKYMEVFTAGTFTFYFKNESGNDRIYIGYTSGDEPTYEKDGVYVDGTLVQEFGEHTANEVKLVKVKFNTGDVLTFVHNGEVVIPKVKTGTGASTKIKSVGGDITCTIGGTFTIYYKFQGGDEGLWIVDEADEIESELKPGDGLIAGETVYAFQPHPDGTNEVKIVGDGDADIEFEEETSFTLKYAGQQVTDFT